MTQDEANALISKSIDLLIDQDHILLDEQYDINERTVTHRLALYLEQVLNIPGYHVDTEYNRMRNSYGEDEIGQAFGKSLNWEASGEGCRYVYPDIVIHQRDTFINLILIEVKMSWKNQLKRLDHVKLNMYKDQLQYQHAAYVELDKSRARCIVEFAPFFQNSIQ